MKKVKTGTPYSYDKIYENGDMSIPMRILKARLIQVLDEQKLASGMDFRNASFILFNKVGGDKGWVLHIPTNAGIIDIHLDCTNIKSFYKNNIKIEIDKSDRDFQYFTYTPLPKEDQCSACKSKKFIREDAWGYIESCTVCNSEYFLSHYYV